MSGRRPEPSQGEGCCREPLHPLFTKVGIWREEPGGVFLYLFPPVRPNSLFTCILPTSHGLLVLDFLSAFCSCFPILAVISASLPWTSNSTQTPPLLHPFLPVELDHLPSHLTTQAKTCDLVWSSLGCSSHGLGKGISYCL